MTTEAEAELNAAFASGYTGEPVATPAAAEPPAQTEQATTTGEGEAAQAVAPTPETVTLTKDVWDSTQATLADLAKFRESATKQFDTLGGKFGEVNRALQNLPKGSALTPERFARIKAEYPELGPLLEEALLPAAGTAAMPQADIDKVVQERLAAMSGPMRQQLMDEIKAESIHEKMLDAHPDYIEVLKSPEFDEWRQGLSFKRAQEITSSNDPRFMVAALNDFKRRNQPAASTPAAAPAAPNPKARLEGAMTPQGTPGKGAPTKTEQDYFREGYQSASQ